MPVAADIALAQPPHAVVIAATTSWKTIVVQPGDTLWDLALAHRTTVGALVAKNRLAQGGHLITPGQKLLVPTPSGTASPRQSRPGATPPAPSRAKASARSYTVRAGDTLFGIAAAHRVPLSMLLRANRLANPRLIHPGQRIVVPTKVVGRVAKPKAPVPTSENTFAGHTFPDATVDAARRNRTVLARRSLPNRTQTAALIRRVATRYGVDPRLALAIAWQESGWSQRAVSVGNAIGTMQVIPLSGKWASDLAGRHLDLLDTEDNITAGVVIIKALLRSAEDREEAIAGYYQGLHSVRTNGLYEDTKTYVAAVLAHHTRF